MIFESPSCLSLTERSDIKKKQQITYPQATKFPEGA